MSDLAEYTARITRRKIQEAIHDGLKSLRVPIPMSACEHAEAYGYLSAESNYTTGRFVPLKFQVAPLNMMGNVEIRELTWIKSARVGATLLMLLATGYKIENRKQTVIQYQPTDDDADSFSKLSADPFIRDVPQLRKVFPSFDKKHKHNTTNLKVFSNGAVWHIKGGKSPRAYRRISADTVMLDELAGFDRNIGGDTGKGEGSARKLAQKRVEGAVHGQTISASTPKILGECLITETHEEANWKFKFNIPCPNCGEHHHLEFGSPDVNYGMKWDKDSDGHPIYDSARYMCPHCHETYDQASFVNAADDGRWQTDEGVWTDDGLRFFDARGQAVRAAPHIGLHIWTAYSPWVAWPQLVREFYQAMGDPDRLQTFHNITLGEAFDPNPGEKVDKEILRNRAEPLGEIPAEVSLITFGADLQGNRSEIEINGWGPGEERYVLGYIRHHGDPTRDAFWESLAGVLRALSFKREDGAFLEIALGCFDSGYLPDQVYNFSLAMGIRYVIPTKGLSTYGSPILKFPKKPNEKGVYLTHVGTDTAKELITRRWGIDTPGDGYTHFSDSPELLEGDYFSMLTAEVRKLKRVKGRSIILWDAENRRNEAFDTHTLNLVAVRIAQQHFGVNLGRRAPVTIRPAAQHRGRRVKGGVRG